MIDLKCIRCGCEGLHACTGQPLPQPTPEDEARLDATLSRIFGGPITLTAPTGVEPEPWTEEQKKEFLDALKALHESGATLSLS